VVSQLELYLLLLALTVPVCLLGKKISFPQPLLLFVAGMLLSWIPEVPPLTLQPEVVLYVFIPLLIYQAASFSSSGSYKKNFRPIAALSVGHVLFITGLVGWVGHSLIPGFTWPVALIFGALISPPDDIAIFSVADRIRFPSKILTILGGEGLFNDATALTLFHFAIALALTHQLLIGKLALSFAAILVGETLYGTLLGLVLVKVRERLKDPSLEMVVSVLTPFLAYLPAEQLGGSGILATVITGLYMNRMSPIYFSPETRLLANGIWDMITLISNGLLFTLIGFQFRAIFSGIPPGQRGDVVFYGALLSTVVIVGRFVWVFTTTYVPRYFSSSLRKKDPVHSWHFPFVIAWSGMRGSISLAAALSIPYAVAPPGGLREVIVFLTFAVICATLVLQGMALPWIVRKFGLDAEGHLEDIEQHREDVRARIEIMGEALQWIASKRKSAREPDRLEQLDRIEGSYRRVFEDLKVHSQNIERCQDLNEESRQTYSDIADELFSLERDKLLKMWREGKVSRAVEREIERDLDLRDIRDARRHV
jgi:CPA1 family monovalent cation:H+ antiporter